MARSSIRSARYSERYEGKRKRGCNSFYLHLHVRFFQLIPLISYIHTHDIYRPSEIRSIQSVRYNNIVLKTCSPRGSSYAPFLPQQLEFFSSKRNISRFRIPSERGCNVVRGGRRKEEEGKGKEARTLESSLIKPLNFLLCHFFLPFPFLFFPPANVRDVFA